MGDLKRNLSRHEIACQCGCGLDTFDSLTADVAQAAVDHFEKVYECKIVLVVTSGNRCKKHNDELRELFNNTNGEQGAATAEDSQHIHCRAMDFKLFKKDTKEQIPADEVSIHVERYNPTISVGYYRNRTHIDSRSGWRKRWGRSK